jgi:hypothetical protein
MVKLSYRRNPNQTRSTKYLINGRKSKFKSHIFFDLSEIIRGDQIGLFKLVTLNCILNCITGVTFGC